MIAWARAGLQNTDVRSETSAAAADRINGYLSAAYQRTTTFLQRTERFGRRNRGADPHVIPWALRFLRLLHLKQIRIVDLAAVGADRALTEERIVGRNFLHLGDNSFAVGGASFSPLYRGQLLVHGLGFSPDHRTLAVVAIGSNAVNFIDTATNTVKHVTYVGRSPHEAFFTPDGKEVLVVVRGENYVAVLDGATYQEKTRIVVANGPGMTIFSPDGKYGYVCSSFTPETAVITVADHKIVGKVQQASPFCPNIAATPDGAQV